MFKMETSNPVYEVPDQDLLKPIKKSTAFKMETCNPAYKVPDHNFYKFVRQPDNRCVSTTQLNADEFQKRKRIGPACFAAVIAILVIAIISIAAIIFANLTSESLQQEFETLKQSLKIEQTNSSKEIKKLWEEKNKLNNVNIQQTSFNEEIRQFMNVSDQKLQQQLNNSMQRLLEQSLEQTELLKQELEHLKQNLADYRDNNSIAIKKLQEHSANISQLQQLNEASLQEQNNSDYNLEQQLHHLVLRTGQLNTLTQLIQELQSIVTATVHSVFDMDINLCRIIFEQDPLAATGLYYWPSLRDGIVNLTCDFDVQLPPLSPVKGWQEIANIDLKGPTNSCPFPLRETTNFPRRCEKSSNSAGCQSVFFPTNRLPFSKFCGRVVGYAVGGPDAGYGGFGICTPGECEAIDTPYVDGISITYSNFSNSSRTHLWTLVAEHNYGGSRCSCGHPPGHLPRFVAADFYCEVAWNTSSPLWEGEGCTDTVSFDEACCENPNLPWFCREFDQPIVADTIEVRLCTDEVRSNEDIQFDLLSMYVQ